MNVVPALGEMPRNKQASQTAPWRIGVDVGGTFTDLVLADGAGVRIARICSASRHR